MSRKKPKKQAVPEEILAEGSGPVGVSDPDVQALADALSDLAVSEPESAVMSDVDPDPDAMHADGRDSDGRDSDSDGRDSDVQDPDVQASDVQDPDVQASDVQDPDVQDSDVQDSDVVSMSGEVDGEGEPDAADGVLPTSAATMDDAQLCRLVEALIFAADRPIALQRLRQLTRISDVRRLEHALGTLAEQYRERGIALQQVSGGYQFRTNTSYSPWVQQLIAGRPVRLSRAQLETLAIVAYRQPITRPEIDEIRGVDSSATLRLLLDRALIRVLGKREEVGRPILYGTTKEFLDFFSLGDLRELPTLREYSELTAESRQVMSDRLGIPLAPEGDATLASQPAMSADGADSVEAMPDGVHDHVEGSVDAVEAGAENAAAIEAGQDEAQADDAHAVEANAVEPYVVNSVAVEAREDHAQVDDAHAVEANAVEANVVGAHAAVGAHVVEADAASADADAAHVDEAGAVEAHAVDAHAEAVDAHADVVDADASDAVEAHADIDPEMRKSLDAEARADLDAAANRAAAHVDLDTHVETMTSDHDSISEPPQTFDPDVAKPGSEPTE